MSRKRFVFGMRDFCKNAFLWCLIHKSAREKMEIRRKRVLFNKARDHVKMKFDGLNLFKNLYY